VSGGASHEARYRARWAARAAIIAIAVWCAAAFAHEAVAAQPARPMLQAAVDPQVIRLPVVEGTDLRFTRLSLTEGLSQTRVTHIVQDDRGFMWFGTQYGLDRYDGYRYKVFKHIPGDPSSLCGVYVYALFKDRAGNLWIGCDRYLDRFDPQTETFVHYQLDPAAKTGSSGAIVHISQDDHGMLWLSTGRGLYRLDPKSAGTDRFQHISGDPTSLASNDIKSTFLDRSGVFWVASSEGLDAFDRASAHVTLHIPLNEPREMSFYEDHAGTFWILYSSNNGLAVFDRKTRRLTRLSFADHDLPGDPLTGVISILEDRDQQLWIATQSDGILKYDREGHRFIRYRNDPSNPESLAENRVTTLYGDLEGVIWAGLGATAPVHFAPHRFPFTKLPYDTSNPANLSETLVNVIYVDSQANLWTGTTGGLNRLDRERARYTRFAIPGAGVSSDVISLVEDRSGELWIGTSGQGLYRLDRGTSRLKAYRHNDADAATLADNTVPRLMIDHRGTLWAATLNGLSRFDPESQRFDTYRAKTDGASAQYISLAEDQHGILWIGTHSSGMLRFDPQTQQFQTIEHDAGRRGTLTDNRVNSLHFDRNGVLWVATQNGLNRFDPATGTFSNYFETDGLASNAVSCILEDNLGDIWMGTKDGISRLDPRRDSFRNYSVADGLPGQDFTGWGACFKSVSGEMFFGGFAGAVAFRPEEVVDSAYTPPVVLTDFELFGTPVKLGAGSPLEKAIGYTTAVKLSHAQNSFSVEFSALSFRSPSTNRYRYKLEGLDSDWYVVGSDRRLARYTTLPPGPYRLRVQGATSRGPWSEPGAALDFSIAPPYWQTLWFRTACGSALLLVLWALYRLRLRQIAQVFNARLEPLSALRRSEAALNEAQQISHTGSWRWKLGTGEVSWSAEHFRIFGFDPATAQPSYATFMERIHAEDRPSFEEAIQRAVREGSRFQHEYRIVLPNGSVKHLQSVGHPDVSKSGDLEFVGTVMDITERRHAEEALRSTQAELARAARLATMGELAASLSHEMNQPLAAIMTNAEAGLQWLNRDEPDLDETRVALSHVTQDAQRASGVIRGLRALANKSGPQVAKLDINEAILEVLTLTRGQLQWHGVVCRTNLSAADRPIFGDRVQLQQVLLNLIINAVDSMSTVTDRPKILAITSEPIEPDGMQVAVEDSGTGLDPAIADRIFDSFFTTKSEGMGMGLSICRTIIDAHGGRISVSPGVPYGTVFRFTVRGTPPI